MLDNCDLSHIPRRGKNKWNISNVILSLTIQVWEYSIIVMNCHAFNIP